MSLDPLAEATRALREDADAAPARPDATRARVLATLRKESHDRARRISLIRAAIPIAAVLVGSMAWAAAGGHLPTSLRAVFPRSQSVPEAPPPPPVLPSLTPSSAPPDIEFPRVEEPVSAPITAPPPAAPTPTFAAPPQPRAARKEPSILAPPAQLPATSPTPPAPVETALPPVAAAPAEPDEQALYAAAHRLHFVEHNPGAALAAWDTYLRAAPRGRLSVEAHYNRALCLVRLGRTAEAESSLQSFARGSYGGYRQTEARALLDALHGAQP